MEDRYFQRALLTVALLFGNGCQGSPEVSPRVIERRFEVSLSDIPSDMRSADISVNEVPQVYFLNQRDPRRTCQDGRPLRIKAEVKGGCLVVSYWIPEPEPGCIIVIDGDIRMLLNNLYYLGPYHVEHNAEVLKQLR